MDLLSGANTQYKTLPERKTIGGVLYWIRFSYLTLFH